MIPCKRVANEEPYVPLYKEKLSNICVVCMVSFSEHLYNLLQVDW